MAGVRFYFDWSNYFTMARLLRSEPAQRNRHARYLRFVLGVPLIAGFHALCFALDPLLFPSLRRTEVLEPTFCIGHARSGTTYLHRLMGEDPQFSYALMYELFFPSLLQKKLLRIMFRIDAATGGRLRHRLDRVEERAFAPTDDIHKTGFFVPEEDDALLTWSLSSGFWIVAFPYMGELDFYHVDRWPAPKRRRMMAFYKECVRRQLALNGGGTHLSKNPTFCGRVESLIETFPDARIVVPMRNPYETIPSLLKLMKTEWSLRGRNEQLVLNSLRVLADQSVDTYTHPLEVLARHPEIRASVVDYRELVGSPANTMRRIYNDLGLELGPVAERAFTAAEARGGHESAHRYSLAEFGLDPREIQSRLADLFDQYQWDVEGMEENVN
ncbi:MULTISPECIES: sulfotransferase [unclassified Mycolicibacterium]|uniref:sulfotransferase family protein n=1 Tax=unclassified Mycolicibacterium TaxID=2636767 RepID=UPI0012DD8E87|nr:MULTISPECIES: sulfotransferase [unclassified Mycolicibacterium]MUL85018.1 sulfotransferase [Mycolicibacterium sp. CBMA 329]MUL90985.1 sulfotransferase [Mycolicibacterium sp. CBMA 331]MUL98344.1 sulfotransferase [Mycolicibacterium sp. CBMA 334]MUM28603.1 sulfotransferase [Mycolicibacterium sp. CBMA 295]MUM40744.1 sulfotransferase [Mycolicibacterium sp. CBMA 247]